MKRIVASLTILAIAWLGTQTLCGKAKACVSLRRAEFSGTKGYVGEARKKGKVVHILAYQNNVINLAGRPPVLPVGSRSQEQSTADEAAEGNAMLLPIPAKPGSMTRFNVVNSSTCPHILSDMARAVSPIARPSGMRFTHGGGGGAPAIQVFDTDIYTVVLARNAKDIPAALLQVRADRRPAINSAIFSAYSRWYPKWTFALCCFNTTKKTSARPLIWWYDPLNPDQLFFPAIDAHNGNPPDLNARVAVDHVLAVGSRLVKFDDTDQASSGSSGGTSGAPTADSASSPVAATSPVSTAQDWKTVQYSDTNIAKDVQDLLPQKVMGSVYRGSLPQGDFIFQTSDVRAGKYSMKRELPPGAPRS